ncbi:hypothetical protein [Chryseobacterium sp.]|uniref:hypothetical protein n=1 Tax=Chryseobacterium sp. TaxID=1871047 RepID=UPI00289B46CF|nr:hypothetical protein [Chryseobacterium sp.]
MKTFIKYDYYTQAFVAICFVILLVVDVVSLQKGYSWIAYFVMAAFHTVSFLIRIFSKNYAKRISFKIYSAASLTILISLLLIIVFKDNSFITEFLAFVLVIGIPLTPILAICYLIIVHQDYEKL